MQSSQYIEDININEFFAKSGNEQLASLSTLDVNKFKGSANKAVLKKFIVLNVFMYTRRAIENNSLFNLTIQFRKGLSFFIPKSDFDIQLGVNPNGNSMYRIAHINHYGSIHREHIAFDLIVDNNNNIVAERSRMIKNDSGNLLYTISEPSGSYECLQSYDLLEVTELAALFKKIKKETRYENTLGYDIFCLAIYGIDNLLILSINSTYLSVVLLSLALVITAAVCAIFIPMVLLLHIIEIVLINPIKWLNDAWSFDEYELFINECCSPVNSYPK